MSQYNFKVLGPESVLVSDMNGEEIARLSGGNTLQIMMTYARYQKDGRESEADLFLFGVTMGLVYGAMGGEGIFRKPLPQPSSN